MEAGIELDLQTFKDSSNFNQHAIHLGTFLKWKSRSTTTGIGPEILNPEQVSRRCWCCWSTDHTRNRKGPECFLLSLDSAKKTWYSVVLMNTPRKVCVKETCISAGKVLRPLAGDAGNPQKEGEEVWSGSILSLLLFSSTEAKLRPNYCSHSDKRPSQGVSGFLERIKTLSSVAMETSLPSLHLQSPSQSICALHLTSWGNLGLSCLALCTDGISSCLHGKGWEFRFSQTLKSLPSHHASLT